MGLWITKHMDLFTLGNFFIKMS